MRPCASAVFEEQQHAHQAMRRGVSQTFVLVPADHTVAIAGFYTLAPAEVSLTDLQIGDARPLRT